MPEAGHRTTVVSVAMLVFGVVLIASGSSAAAQSVRAPPVDGPTLRAALAEQMSGRGKPMPSDAAELDAFLAGKKWVLMSERLLTRRDAKQVGLDLNWEQKKLYGGAGFLVAYTYMTDLWRLGSGLSGETGSQLKQMSGAMFLYALDLIKLDGIKCADISAPGHRQDQLFAQNRPLIAYIRGLPLDKRMTLGTISLALEGATASVRTNDETLCTNGLAEISAGLKAKGNAPLRQVPNAPGTVGKTYAVPKAPGYKPKFVGADIWTPKQGPIRQSLAGYLTDLLGTLGDAGTPVPPK